MNIVIEKYILYPEPNAPGRWNLYEKQVVQKGKTAGKEIENVISYGITLTRAIEIMASMELMWDEREMSLREFLDEYKKVYEKLKKLVEV
jgi:hypothetical protein